MKILFLSPTNLTTNPRLLKELKIAVAQGHEVHFVGFDLDNWSQKIDAEISANLNCKLTYIPITRKHKTNWILSTFAETVCKKLALVFNQNLKINAFANSKRSYLLTRYLNRITEPYDLIAAHVLPTLYPAYKLSKKHNIPFIFDIEDYHPGEATSDEKDIERRKFLMQKLLPKASFITYASPLIGEFTFKLFNPTHKTQNSKLVNNCFSQTEFQYKENNSEKIKFVWFSQNIAAGRGLELVLPALATFKNKVELHLIGNLYQAFYDDYLSDYKDLIVLHEPLPQKDLNLKLSEFDVGLAIEPGKDLNNNIAVSNKIWAYLQSGLYILATNTPAQVQFLEEHTDSGLITKQNSDGFSKIISEIIKNITEIRHKKQDRFENAKKISWETESDKLIDIWNKTL